MRQAIRHRPRGAASGAWTRGAVRLFAAVLLAAGLGTASRLGATPPDPAADLAATPGAAEGAIRLTWSASGDDGATGALLAGSSFYIQRSTFVVAWSTADAQILIATSAVNPGDPQEYVVGGLFPGSTHYFRLWTSDPAGNVSALSSGATSWAQDLAPGVPTGLSASAGNAVADLSWTANPEADIVSYEVYQSSWSSTLGFTFAATVPGTTHQAAGLVNGNTYYYKIWAVDAASHFSAFSSVVSTRPAVVVGAPAVSTHTVASSTGSIRWAWTAAANADGYRVIQSTSSAAVSSDLSASVTYFVEADLPANSSHTVHIQAFSGLITQNSGTTGYYTLAAVPASLASPVQTLTTLDLSWGGGNPAGTRHDVERSTNGVDTWTLRASLITATTHQETGLSEYTTYHYRIFAYNGDNVKTSASTVLSTRTAGTPPAAVSNLQSAPGSTDGTVQLSWTAPGDDDASGTATSYIVRYATFDVTAANFDDVNVSTFVQSWSPVAAGNLEGVNPNPVREVTGLYAGTTYYFAVKAVDEAGLSGTWSTAGVNTLRSNYAYDRTPDAVTGLAATGGASSIALSWTQLANAPDLDFYRIYRSSTPPYVAFSSVGVTAAGGGGFNDPGLDNETTYVYKVTSVDKGTTGDFFSVALESAFSSTATAVTLDTIAPATVSNLSALTGNTEGQVRLTWTSPGDDGGTRNISNGRLRIDYSTNVATSFSTVTFKVNLTTSATAGQSMSHTLTGLTAQATYYIRLWLVDESTNSAGLSNGATTWAQADVTPPSSITDLQAAAGWRQVQLSWTSPGDNGSSGALIGNFRIRYSTTAAITNDAQFNAASLEALLPTAVSPGVAMNYTINGLTNGVTHYFAIRAEDDRANAGGVVALSTASACPANATPGAFALSSPADLTVSTSTAARLFDWGDSTDANTGAGDTVSYGLEYSTDSTFAGGVVQESTVSTSQKSVSLAGLTEDVTTYWRVRAVDMDGAQAVSSSFRIFLNQANTPPAAFSLSSPADGAISGTAQPTLDWTDSSDVDPGTSLTYRVDYTTDAAFSTYASSAGITASQFIPAALQENATYYWRVAAQDGVNTTTATPASRSFRVNAVPSSPDPFSLLTPADEARSSTTSLTFTWGSTADPDPGDTFTYTLFYSFFQNFATSTTVAGLSSTSYSTGTLDNVPLYWFVEAVDSGGNKRRSTPSQRVVLVDVAKELPSSFDLLTPTGNVIVPVLKPLLQWSAAIDPDPFDTVRYSLDLSDRADFAGVQGIPLTDTFFQVTNNLVDDTTYYWRVRAAGYQGIPPVNQDGSEILVATGVFVVAVANTPPQTFPLESPANNAAVQTVTPSFDWQDADDVDLNEVITYTLVISTASDFSGTSTTVAGLTASSCSLPVSLMENRTYHWKVLAQDKDGAVTPSASSFLFTIPVLNRPKPPAGVRGTLSSNRQTFTFQWSAVTSNEDGTTLSDLAEYRVYRALLPDALGDDTAVAVVAPGTTFYEDTTVNGGDFFYAVRAVDGSGNESVNSLLVESKSKAVFVALAEDRQAQVLVDSLAARDLTSETNGRGEDVLLDLVRRASEEVGAVLRSYEVRVRGASTERALSGFLFQRPVEIAFAANPSGGASPARRALSGAPSLPAEQMSVYWFNGVEFIKLGGVYDAERGVISVSSQRPGIYRLQQALQAGGFEVVQTWPKKIFTPNGDGINDEMNFVYNNPKGVPVSGRVFDVLGGEVAELRPGKDASSLVWDGQDVKGGAAPKGVYLYQIEADGRTYTGSVVVAR